jgi:hypothetical protein
MRYPSEALVPARDPARIAGRLIFQAESKRRDPHTPRGREKSPGRFASRPGVT